MKIKQFLSLVLLTLLVLLLPFSAIAQDNLQDDQPGETELEQSLARAAELNPNPPAAITALAGVNAFQYPLFVGVDDAAIPAYQIDPVTNDTVEAFVGAQVWGAAYDPVNRIVYFNNGSTLYEWPVGGTVNTLGTIVDAGAAAQAMVGLAFYNGTLYGIKNIANEAVWIINPATLLATVHIDYADADFDLGGLAADPNTGELYATNDDTTPHGSGLFRINLDGTGTLIAPYPDAQTDIDGLAISDDGFAYLVTDEPGFIYVYNFTAAAYTTPLNNPWTTAEVFSSGAWLFEPSIAMSKTVGTDPLACAVTDEITIMSGEEATYCFTVENTGDVTLNLHTLFDSDLGTILNNFSYALSPGASAFLTQTVTLLETTVNTATWAAYNANASYAFNDAALYSFTDISATGTPLNLGDDGAANATMPFQFTYFGFPSDQVRIGNNGGMLFGTSVGGISFTNAALPNAGHPLAIFPYWDDLDSETGNVYYQTIGSAPDRQFVVQWHERPHFPGPGLGNATFQAILYEGSNQILFQYADLDFGDPALNFGASATVGLNKDGVAAVQYSFNTAALSDGLAILWSPTSVATASDSAIVNVLAPEISLEPETFTSLQAQDSIVTQTLTISNVGDPGTTLDWNIGEGISPMLLDATTPRFEGQTSPAVEVVGDKAPDKVDSAPSALGLVSEPFAPTAVLYDNGPLVTHPGGGAGGADASALQTALGMNFYGFNHAVSGGWRVADDFTITDPSGWNIEQITFFAYQTGSGTGSTITAVNLRIWDGPPELVGSNVIFGDTTTNRLTNTTWTNIYRVLDTNLAAIDRPVMANTVSVGVVLPPGTYWLDWQSDGSLASGPWVPAISILGQTDTGNALQYEPVGGTWNPATDVGLQGLPFVIEGASAACGVDLAWVSVSPLSGLLLDGESSDLQVIFDSTGLLNGVYTGQLCVNSNDPLNPLVTVPLTMTVADVAYLEVAHLAPFAADPGTAVTVTVDGAPVLPGFEYGDSTGYVTLHAGEHLIEIYPQSSITPAITATVDLITDTFSSAIAVGGAYGWPLDLLLLDDDLSAPAAGNFKLRLGHLAPFAAGAGSLADVRLQDGTVLLDDVPFGSVAPYLELPAGTHDLKITSPDGALTLIDPLPVTFAVGEIVAAFASGDGANQPLGAFAWPSGTAGFFLPLASYAVELSPAQVAGTGAPAETVMYTLQVTNTSDVTDTFGVSFSGNVWDAHLVQTSLELATGESAELGVHVMIPAGAEEGDLDLVTIQVSGTGGQTASSELTTTAVISGRTIFLPVIPKGYTLP